jgi:ribose 5-phosphate isomerase
MAESKIEGAKKLAAISAVNDHFDVSFKYVGIGSGTTILYVVEAIKAVLLKSNPQVSSNPTTRPGTLVQIPFLHRDYINVELTVCQLFNSYPQAISQDRSL